MSDFELRLGEIVNNYFRKNGKYPNSISMSWRFRDEFLKTPYFMPSMMNKRGEPISAWSGFPIKFVRR